MKGFRLSAAVALGKATAAISRAFNLGGGTTMPGRVARAIDPGVMRSLAGALPHGTIVVTGTNGKTTTSRLITHILSLTGLTPVHNRAGANLAAGITAALVRQAALAGRPRGDIGVFEVDEATLPLIAESLTPRVVVLTNLFRDQLDRYGEIDLVAGRWQSALDVLGARTTVVFNADDPLVATVAAGARGSRLAFGIEDAASGLETLEHAADARYCYRCGVAYAYAAVYFGHMGIYHCGSCGTTRPVPEVAARDVEAGGITGGAFTLHASGGARRVRTSLPGLYNVHNVLAAAACCLAIRAPFDTVVSGIETFAPAFGRAERVRINGRDAVMLLAKNPAGFNEVLRTVLRDGGAGVVLIAINDLTADGRDISWLWDVDFEMLAGRCRLVITSGLRAHDMNLRLKYAGVPETARLLSPVLSEALDAAVGAAADGEPVYILPTYTAMLHLRGILQRRGHVSAYWDD